MNRADFQQLSDTRMREAETLLKTNEFSGAYYLSGYAVECALKACFAKTVQKYDFPDKLQAAQVFTHKLPALAKLAGIDAQIDAQAKADTNFAGRWLIVSRWNEESRYQIWSRVEAEQMVEAIANTKEGILPWLKQRW